MKRALMKGGFDMTKSKDDTKTFELAGQVLSLEGTSGLSKLNLESATGEPVFHDVSFGGQVLSLSNTSGVSKYPQHTAQGQPSYQRTAVDSGSGELGQPAVIRGLAGVYPK
jgi:hypothetical protein